MLQSIWLSLKCFDVVPAKNGSPLSLFSYWTLDGILQIFSWNIKARNKNKLEKQKVLRLVFQNKKKQSQI